MNAGILTVSDRSSQGVRDDLGGPMIKQWLKAHGVETDRQEIIPDDIETISERLKEWGNQGNLDIILTTGGTGVSPRDVTPDATALVVERLIPGFGELMRAESLKKTPMAIISRAVAGIINRSLIINLPGSPKAAIENLEAVWGAVPHTVAKIQGDTGDCAPIPPENV
jgi:molybdenum cofactor synthesis domain-containing protein